MADPKPATAFKDALSAHGDAYIHNDWAIVKLAPTDPLADSLANYAQNNATLQPMQPASKVSDGEREALNRASGGANSPSVNVLQDPETKQVFLAVAPDQMKNYTPEQLRQGLSGAQHYFAAREELAKHGTISYAQADDPSGKIKKGDILMTPFDDLALKLTPFATGKATPEQVDALTKAAGGDKTPPLYVGMVDGKPVMVAKPEDMAQAVPGAYKKEMHDISSVLEVQQELPVPALTPLLPPDTSPKTAEEITNVTPVHAPPRGWVRPVPDKDAPPQQHENPPGHAAPDARPWVMPVPTSPPPHQPHALAPAPELPPSSLASVSPDVLKAALAAVTIPKMAHQDHTVGKPPEGNRVQMAEGLTNAAATGRTA